MPMEMTDHTPKPVGEWDILLPLILTHREQLGLSNLAEVGFLLYLLDMYWKLGRAPSMQEVGQAAGITDRQARRYLSHFEHELGLVEVHRPAGRTNIMSFAPLYAKCRHFAAEAAQRVSDRDKRQIDDLDWIQMEARLAEYDKRIAALEGARDTEEK